MKLLIDENLSDDLVEILAQDYPGTDHVRKCGLKSATDRMIWTFAGENEFVIVTRDWDFIHLASLLPPPPKIIWIGLGNCPTMRVALLLMNSKTRIHEFCMNPEKSFLAIG